MTDFLVIAAVLSGAWSLVLSGVALRRKRRAAAPHLPRRLPPVGVALAFGAMLACIAVGVVAARGTRHAVHEAAQRNSAVEASAARLVDDERAANRPWMIAGAVVTFGIIPGVLVGLLEAQRREHLAFAAREAQAVRVDAAESDRSDDEDRRLEDELYHLQKLEALGAFAAGVAHDVKNALTALLGYVSIARRGIDSPEVVSEALEGIERASRQTADVAKTLLNMSRPSHGRRAPVNFAELVRTEVLALRPTLGAVEIDTEVEEPAWTEAEEAQLRQLLVNLVLNARDAVPDDGHVCVRVRSVIGARYGQADVELTVEDNGAGMTPEVRERMFDPFFTTRSRTEGTGLGLTIVHSIVRNHGGAIDVESRVGEGTRVIVKLTGCAAPPTTSEPSPASARRAHNVLVVVENPQVRAVIASALRTPPDRVVPAGNPEAALRELEHDTNRFDVAIVDLDDTGRDGHDGWACVRHLHARCPALPIIALGSSKRIADPDATLPAVTLLCKPFDMIALTARVEELAGLREARGYV